MMVWQSILYSAFFAVAVQGVAQLPTRPSHDVHDNSFLIKFAENTPEDVRNTHLKWLESLGAANPAVNLRHKFSLGFQGYSARLDANALEQIRNKNEISSIEHVGVSPAQNLTVSVIPPAAASNQLVGRQSASVNTESLAGGWNNLRLAQRDFKGGYSGGTYTRSKTAQGKGVTVYVLDTGVNLQNQGFTGSSVSFGKSFVGNSLFSMGGNAQGDNHGHGTMCAGVIAGKKHGIAPQAKMISVKIADDMNRSACDDVVAGIEWVLSQPGDNNLKVISMSHYGFTGYPDVSKAVSAAVSRGLHFVTCAGNEGRNACLQPNNAAGVISVASVNALNKLPVKGSFDAGGRELESTNTGQCVTVFAPGSRVPTLSNRYTNYNYQYFGYGTSIAAPQVAAIIANRLSDVGKQTPAQIKSWLQSSATKNQVVGSINGAPNLIAYNGVTA